MDAEEQDDDVVAEYPLYAASLDGIFASQAGDIRLVQLQYPLRPPWRGYDLAHVKEVTYKPQHRIVSLTVPEDQPAGRQEVDVHLRGTGQVPQAPLCAMCKVAGAFVLMPVDEVTALRPDLERMAADQAKREAEAQAKIADGDFKPSTSKGKVKAEPGTEAPADVKPAMQTLTVEVQKRENERTAAMRERSHAHLRERIAAESAVPLKAHSLDAGHAVLHGACEQLMKDCPAAVPMGLPAREYLRLLSPATYTPEAPSGAAGPAQAQPAGGDPATDLDDATLEAIKLALEKLFEEQGVVTMPDVRVWLQTYAAAPKAQAGAALSDPTLASLLLGGGSILLIRGRFVLRPEEDPFKGMVLDLLKQSAAGIRKADVMAEASLRGLTVREHEYGKVLRELCVAKGALWDLKEGASFANFGK